MRNWYECINCDCMDVLGYFAGVDAVIVDVPYGTTRCKWDDVIPLPAMWAALKKLGDIPMVFTAAAPFSARLVVSNLEKFKHEWVWHKNRATGHLNARRAPMKDHESILVFCSGRYFPQKTQGHKYKGRTTQSSSGECYGDAKVLTPYMGGTERFPRSVQDFDCERGLHPTQKPVPLMEYLIKTYTQPGEVVLDFTMGSGTTGVAAANTGRNFIGIEKDAAIFEAARARIGAAYATL